MVKPVIHCSIQALDNESRKREGGENRRGLVFMVLGHSADDERFIRNVGLYVHVYVWYLKCGETIPMVTLLLGDPYMCIHLNILTMASFSPFQ